MARDNARSILKRARNTVMLKNVLGACCLMMVGCGSASSYVRAPETTLGRVVIYRNGVAYFERVANVEGDTLKLAVPADKVDDFLKSLTVVDAKTGEPAPVAYPTNVPTSGTGLIDMQIRLPGAAPHQLKLSYVTEAPSWKPSYRLVVGKQGKVDLQGWAVVDNTSGEDWNNIRLGVGSSSAMSFRFDLRSVRMVERERLQTNDLFAQAPPMGGATYGRDDAKKIVGEFSDESLAFDSLERKEDDRRAAATSPYAAPAGTASMGAGLSAGRPRTATAPSAPPPPPAAKAAQIAASNNISNIARAMQSQNRQIVVEGYSAAGDKDKYAASLERANKMREQLVRNGIDAGNVVAVGRGEQTGRSGGVRLVEAPSEAKPTKTETAAAPAAPADPIGTSHFESTAAMSVARGTSAMVSILHADTEGEVVYLYDPESVRGNASFPFKAVRIKNPTDSELESGPVTVFGDGRFIGEGMCEPIPARSTAFVPFALDRQIVVEKGEGERDDIERILTVQRGVFSTEVRHTKKSTLTLYNRTSERAVVYLRHTVAPGYKLGKSPQWSEKVGGAHVFRVELEPGKKNEVVIEEATPLFKTTDIRTPGGLEMVRVYLSSAAVEGPLKQAVSDLLKLHLEMAKIEQQIGTTREQNAEYRVRMDELHVQIVTLKAVKSAGPLMKSLEGKLSEVSDKISKGTIDLVTLQEKLMVARIHFQDGVADLSLEKKPEAEKTASK